MMLKSKVLGRILNLIHCSRPKVDEQPKDPSVLSKNNVAPFKLLVGKYTYTPGVRWIGNLLNARRHRGNKMIQLIQVMLWVLWLIRSGAITTGIQDTSTINWDAFKIRQVERPMTRRRVLRGLTWTVHQAGAILIIRTMWLTTINSWHNVDVVSRWCCEWRVPNISFTHWWPKKK